MTRGGVSDKMSLKRVQRFFDDRAAGWDAQVDPQNADQLAAIMSGLSIAPRARVLDVGCGTGVLLPFLARKLGPAGNAVAIDLSLHMLRQLRLKAPSGVRCVQCDALQLPFQPGSFEWVICYSVFPHFEDQPSAVACLAEALAPGGRLVICHSKSRDAINAFHRTVGDVVGGHELLDSAHMRQMLQAAELTLLRLEDTPERYVVEAQRPR